MPLVLAGATSGQATIQATDAQTVTLTLPATTGTLAVSGGSPSFATLTVTGDASISGLTVGKGTNGVTANTALGNGALIGPNSGSGNNTAIGYQSSYNNTSGAYNVSVGQSSLYSNTTGILNVALGQASLFYNTSGSYNVAVGPSALIANTTASNNTAVGYQTLKANTTGAQNTAVGLQALGLNTTGQSNVALGFTAGNVISTGSNNVCLGYAAGSYSTPLTTGSQNLFVGTNTGPSSATVDYEMVIACLNSVGKGGATGYINPQGGSMYQGNNGATWAVISDARLKKNIVNNNNGLDIISQIQVRNFEYRLPEEVTDLPQNQAIEKVGLQIGVIAQEIQQVSAEFVKEESTGVLRVDADNLTWYLINAVKELKATVDAQAARIASLEGAK